MNFIVEAILRFRASLCRGRSITMTMDIGTPGFEDFREVCSSHRQDVMVSFFRADDLSLSSQVLSKCKAFGEGRIISSVLLCAHAMHLSILMPFML